MSEMTSIGGVDRKRRLFVFLVSCAISLPSLSGCGDVEDNGRGTADSEDYREHCRGSRDCPTGYTCEDLLCTRVPTSCVEDDECLADETCVGGRCARSSGSGITGSRDAGLEDTVECTRRSDCPDGQSCVDNLCRPPGEDLFTPDSTTEEANEGADTPPETSGGDESVDECEGREDGLLGDSCSGASGCCNGLCLGDPLTDRGFCTERCEDWSDCNPLGFSGNYFCYNTGDDGRFCATSDYEDSCDVPENCVGAVCLKGLGTNGCSYQCNSSSECQPGSACGETPFDDGYGGISYLWTCAPVGGNCMIDTGTGLNNCLSGLCLTPDDGGLGYCSVFCNATDPSACPSGYACDIAEEGYPRVCLR